jgi:hypothetical protein
MCLGVIACLTVRIEQNVFVSYDVYPAIWDYASRAAPECLKVPDECHLRHAIIAVCSFVDKQFLRRLV